MAALTYAEAAAGDLAVALDTADRALAAGAGDADLGSDLAFLRPVVFLTGLRGSVLTQLGRLDEAGDALAQAIAITDPDRDAEVAGWIGGWQVELARASGATDGTIDDGRRALQVAERRGSPFSRVVALAYLGRAHALRAEWPEAVAALERSLALARARRTGLEAEAAVLADLAEASLGAGDGERALRLANEAVEVARRRGQKIGECVANRVLARVLLEKSAGTKRRLARKYLDRALSLARETGALALEPAIHLGFAEVARLSGDELARQAALETAAAICREIGADALAERIGADLPPGVERAAPDTPADATPAPASAALVKP
jgi:tetratricopeptide (TPR) repeat protein